MKIELTQAQLTWLIECLGTLAVRSEAEAAVLASTGETGRPAAERRLKEAQEAAALQDYLLKQ